MRALLLVALCLMAAACQRRESGLSCQDLRANFDKAFAGAVEEGAARRFDRQETHMREGQRAYVAMEAQGCCKEPGMCPAMNVR